MGLSDDSLLAGMASGDDEASAAFVRRFQSRVYGLALAIVRTPSVAEDVAQEAFVRAWRNADAYDVRRGRVVTWLLAITRNVAIDSLRASRQPAMDPSELAELLVSNTHDDLTTYEEVELLRDSLRRLPADQSRVVLLSAFYGFTSREISNLDTIPLGTVKSRLRRGLMKLKSRMEMSDD